MDRRTFIASAALAALPLKAGAADLGPRREIAIRLDQDAGPFPHSWEACVGSDRASVALRAQWQADLALTQRLTGMRSVRFHGLLDDDLGVCPSVGADGPRTNFLYLDQIFDRMLEIGVKPFIELSFMPTALASGTSTIFWYRGQTSPPRRFEDWQALIHALAVHLVERYGAGEVAQWRFECWNEPNIDFWSGTQAQYFELYRRTAAALKAADRRLQVGGPATAQMAWIPDFLADCARHGTPVDFVSSHIYPDDPQQVVFGRAGAYPYEEVMPRALAKAREQIRASAFPDLPLVISEWSSQNPALIAQTIRDCAGLADTLSYWAFSDVFEEQGPIPSFRNDAYGLVGDRGVPRPSFNAFVLLHRLGERRLAVEDGPVLATRRADGSAAVLAWNLIPQGALPAPTGDLADTPSKRMLTDGPALPLRLRFQGGEARRVKLSLVDPAHDGARQVYEASGRPASPTVEQIGRMRAAGLELDEQTLVAGSAGLDLVLPPNSVALVELGG